MRSHVESPSDLVDVIPDPPQLLEHLAQSFDFICVPLRPPGQMDQCQRTQPTSRCRRSRSRGLGQQCPLRCLEPNSDLLTTSRTRGWRRRLPVHCLAHDPA